MATPDTSEQLDIDWTRFADGRVWRLRPKRHYPPDVPMRRVRQAAAEAAREMGKVVQTLDQGNGVWIQFSDARIRLGEPCPCGSRRLLRLHTLLVRCPECGRQLALDKSSVAADDGSGEDGLAELNNIRLEFVDRSEVVATYRGYGYDGDEPVLVVAEFEAKGDEPLTANDAASKLLSVQKVRFDLLDGVIDTRALLDRPQDDWDLLL